MLQCLPDVFPTPPSSPVRPDATSVTESQVVEAATTATDSMSAAVAVKAEPSSPAAEHPAAGARLSPKPECAADAAVGAAVDADVKTATAAGMSPDVAVKPEPSSTAAKMPVDGARPAQPGGFTDYKRSVPFWAKMKVFNSDLGLRVVNTRHAGRNLCLCFSALLGAGEISESQQG